MATSKATKAKRSAQIERLKKALSTSTAARTDFALQQAGWTQEEQDFNRASYEFLIQSWCALSRIYADTMDTTCGPDWYARGI